MTELELAQLTANTMKLVAETGKLLAEERKLKRDYWLAPLMIAISLLSAIVGGLIARVH
jgi:hypothetical protein